ncbi:MAG TPA: hypothetical protein VIN09_14145 [Chloroflexota bacterium]
MGNIVVGVFDDRGQAEEASRKLEQALFLAWDLGVVTPDVLVNGETPPGFLKALGLAEEDRQTLADLVRRRSVLLVVRAGFRGPEAMVLLKQLGAREIHDFTSLSQKVGGAGPAAKAGAPAQRPAAPAAPAKPAAAASGAARPVPPRPAEEQGESSPDQPGSTAGGDASPATA